MAAGGLRRSDGAMTIRSRSIQTSAMAWWGVALAAGPNYNDPGDGTRDKRAYGAIQKALALRKKVSEPERAYVDAVAKRYTAERPPDRKALDRAYADAMHELVRRYP